MLTNSNITRTIHYVLSQLGAESASIEWLIVDCVGQLIIRFLYLWLPYIKKYGD